MKMNFFSRTIKWALDTTSSLVTTYGLLTILPKTAVAVGTEALGAREVPVMNPVSLLLNMHLEPENQLPPLLPQLREFVQNNPHSPYLIPLKAAYAASNTIDSLLSVNWNTIGEHKDAIWTSIKEHCTTKEFVASSGLANALETNFVGTHFLTGYALATMLNSSMGEETIAPAAAMVLFGTLDAVIYLPGLLSDSVDFLKGCFSSEEPAKSHDL